MTTMRKKIAEHMIMSRRTSAHVHGIFEVDVTRIVKLRESMKGKFEQATGNKLTYNDASQLARAVEDLGENLNDVLEDHRESVSGAFAILDSCTPSNAFRRAEQ